MLLLAVTVAETDRIQTHGCSPASVSTCVLLLPELPPMEGTQVSQTHLVIIPLWPLASCSTSHPREKYLCATQLPPSHSLPHPCPPWQCPMAPYLLT